MTYTQSYLVEETNRCIEASRNAMRTRHAIPRRTAIAALCICLAGIAGCDGGESAPAGPSQPETTQPGAPAALAAPAAAPAAPVAAQPQQPAAAPPGVDLNPVGPTGTAERVGPNRKDGDNRTLPVDLVRFVPEGSCTRKRCPPDKPCCNTCRFRRWRPLKGEFLTLKGSTSETRNIPRCQMNGCERCAFHLLANGVRSGNKFMAFEIRKVSPAGAADDE